MHNLEQKIGFDRIRTMVADNCNNDLAINMAESMRFITDYDTLKLELDETEEMRNIVLMAVGFPQQDFFDLTPTLSHLRIGGTAIEQKQLFNLRCSLQTIDGCLHFFLDNDECPYHNLKRRALEVAHNETVEITSKSGKTTTQYLLTSLLLKDLLKIIDDHGDIYDNASPELAEIRRTMARKAVEVDSTINRQLSRAKREGWANENAEVTIRNGRLVIPILDTHRRKIKGLIHDESATRQTAYLEPSDVVELNNDLRELEFDERHEIQHILMSFSDSIRPQLPMLEECYSLLARIDFLRAKAKVAIQLNAFIPKLTEKPMIDWLDARHPLLFLQKGDGVVPFSVTLGESQRILIISGPNAGGKSVCLKAIGLIQYMLQCGMPVPCRPTSEFGIFGSVFIDIGDQQSIDDDLSTYTSHLQNMKQLLNDANDSTLFLLDELGGGTEPRSGCAIAEAVLEKLDEKGCFGIVTTHFADLKLLADHHSMIINGAMLFDTEKMHPLYRLSIGHPGSSFAFEIAESIGFPKEVIERAGKKVGSAQLNFEHQLQQLELDKQEVAKQKEELRVADDFLNEVTQKYQRLTDRLEGKRHDIVNEARKQAQQILANANRLVEQTISDIKSTDAEKGATHEARQKLETAKVNLNNEILKSEQRAENREQKKKTYEADAPITVGSIVRIDGQETYAQVVEIKGKKAVVESNSMRMTIALDRLHGTAKQKIPTAKQESTAHHFASVFDDINEKRKAFNPTLDLRGMRADEAINKLDHFIDEAMLLSEKEIRILHGTGYGILKQIVRQELQARRDVKSFHPERIELGGEGITIAELR